MLTSFQFTKRDRVQKLLDDLNAVDIPSYIICSYDFDGRPVKGPYAKNIEHFADYITSINMVATTISIKKFMADEDEYFHYLYEKFDNFYFDDYIPDRMADAPSGVETGQRWIHLRTICQLWPITLVKDANLKMDP